MHTTRAQAIVFEAPQTRSVQTLELKAFENGTGPRLIAPHDRVVRVAPELGPKAVMGRLLARIGLALAWPALTLGKTLPGHGALSLLALVTRTLKPGSAREACELAFCDPQCLEKTMDGRA